MKKLKATRSNTTRQIVVAAGARWMDRHYPTWFRGVVHFVRENRFNIHITSACVIGAGTGQHWTEEEADRINTYVSRTTGLDATDLTASMVFEGFWIAEAFKRLGLTGGR